VSGKPGDDVRPGAYRAVLRQTEQMIRKYTLIIEGDSAGYSGYVPELPTILVTGNSIEDLTVRAKEAIGLYWETLHADWSPGSTIREIEVEQPVEV